MRSRHKLKEVVPSLTLFYLLFCLMARSAAAVDLFNFGSSHGDQELPSGSQESTVVNLTEPIAFLGKQYDFLRVSAFSTRVECE